MLMAARPASALSGINPDGSLDKPAISKAYFEGEFQTVIDALEAFRRSGKAASREDSIYTFKYLGVVYAAEPATRLKAESYMYQLIRMAPKIDLLDLYISDTIHGIFLKVKGDYEDIERSRAVAAESGHRGDPGMAGSPSVPSTEGEPAPVRKHGGLRIWAPIALGGAGLATAAYFLAALQRVEDENRSPRPVAVSVEWPKEGSR